MEQLTTRAVWLIANSWTQVRTLHRFDAPPESAHDITPGNCPVVLQMRDRGARGDMEPKMSRSNGVAKLSLTQLQLEIARRQRDVGRLVRRRERIIRQLAEVDAEIIARGGPVKGWGGRKRPKNESPLLDALKAVLKGKTMGVSEAAEAVQKAGYQTSSPNFRTIVNQTLLKRKHFKRVERGQYTAV